MRKIIRVPLLCACIVNHPLQKVVWLLIVWVTGRSTTLLDDGTDEFLRRGQVRIDLPVRRHEPRSNRPYNGREQTKQIPRHPEVLRKVDAEIEPFVIATELSADKHARRDSGYEFHGQLVDAHVSPGITVWHLCLQGKVELVSEGRDENTQGRRQLLLQCASVEIALHDQLDVSNRVATDEVFDVRCHSTDFVLGHIAQFIDVLSRDDKDLGVIAANLE